MGVVRCLGCEAPVAPAGAPRTARLLRRQCCLRQVAAGERWGFARQTRKSKRESSSSGFGSHALASDVGIEKPKARHRDSDRKLETAKRACSFAPSFWRLELLPNQKVITSIRRLVMKEHAESVRPSPADARPSGREEALGLAEAWPSAMNLGLSRAKTRRGVEIVPTLVGKVPLLVLILRLAETEVAF